jgi:hypothetical protein
VPDGILKKPALVSVIVVFFSVAILFPQVSITCSYLAIFIQIILRSGILADKYYKVSI